MDNVQNCDAGKGGGVTNPSSPLERARPVIDVSSF
jgi:hypothetical protein